MKRATELLLKMKVGDSEELKNMAKDLAIIYFFLKPPKQPSTGAGRENGNHEGLREEMWH